tara:strand:+ start:3013 stop:3189 length:177 start_codon:yes stop_codon:yes gene_type:complete
MRNKKKLLVEQLDKKLKIFSTIKTETPIKGWIHTIRTSLNMTMEQLGTKLFITKQGIE